MTRELDRQIIELAGQAAGEKDPNRMLQIVAQLNRALDQKAEKLKAMILANLSDAGPQRESQ
jgi:hypothetical protein